MKIFGFAGWSGRGKTTLIERLIPILARRAGKVSLVKHAHHESEIDQPGKDSFRHRQAGCSEVLVSSSRRYALIHELRGEREQTLAQLVGRLSPCELVLVEGFKSFPIPKLEVWRPSVRKPLLYREDAAIRGIATDDPPALTGSALPVFLLDDVDEIATFVLREAGIWPVAD
jgi:molybdopterin-guanine dinucleotide biosynthesis protein B